MKKSRSRNKQKIPIIAITSENVDDDEDNAYGDIADAHTDVEFVDMDASGRQKKEKKRKSKLMVKLASKDDGGTTDMEDVEGSDDDKEKSVLVKHRKPLDLDEIILKTDNFEEDFKLQSKDTFGKRKLKSQGSTVHEPQRSLGLDKHDMDQGLTDTEDLYASDQDLLDGEIPDIDLSSDLLLESELTSIFDSMRKTLQTSPSPAVTPYEVSEAEETVKKNKAPSKQHLSALSLSPHLSDLTDTEIIHSDSDEDSDNDDNLHNKRRGKYRRRKPKGSLRNSGAVTDIEDIDMSGDESGKYAIAVANVPGFSSNKPQKPFKKMSVPYAVDKMHSIPSLLYDSDNEDDDKPDIISGKRHSKPNDLVVPEIGHDGLTDVEDFEGEGISSDEHDDEPKESNELPPELEKTLQEMETFYGSVKEAHGSKQGKQMYKMETHTIQVPEYEDQNATDYEDYESERENEPEQSGNVENSELEEFGIKFSNKGIPKVDKFTQPLSLLIVPESKEEATTDVENLDSSDDEHNNVPMAYAILETAKTDNLTDCESIDGDSLDTKDIPDLELPKPYREAIKIVENKSSKPTVTVMPLDEDYSGGFDEADEDVKTDSTEDMDYDNYLGVSGSTSRALTPDLPILEGGYVDIAEKCTSVGLNVPSPQAEPLTDEEEVHLSTNTKKMKRKHNKFLQKQSNLAVDANDEQGGKTDVEDMNLSDADSISQERHTTLLVVSNDANPATDVEDLYGSDEDPHELMDLMRALSTTPQHMRELCGETVITKEKIGPATKQDILTVSRNIPTIRLQTYTPVPTDTEEMMLSGDEGITAYSRADTVTPVEVGKEIDESCSSKVYDETMRKIDLDAAEEVMYIKGGGYSEEHTEVEDVSEDDGNLMEQCDVADKNDVSVQVGNNQISVLFKKADAAVSLNWRKGSASFLYDGSVSGNIPENNRKLEDNIVDTRTVDIVPLLYYSIFHINPQYISTLTVFPHYKCNLSMLYLNFAPEIEHNLSEVSVYDIGIVPDCLRLDGNAISSKYKRILRRRSTNIIQRKPKQSFRRTSFSYSNDRKREEQLEEREEVKEEAKVIPVKTKFNIDSNKPNLKDEEEETFLKLKQMRINLNRCTNLKEKVKRFEEISRRKTCSSFSKSDLVRLQEGICFLYSKIWVKCMIQSLKIEWWRKQR